MADTLVALTAALPPAEKASFGFATHTAIGSVTTGANTATFTAIANQQWFCTHAQVSFAATPGACTFTITDGAGGTVLYQAEFGASTAPLPTVFDFQQRPLHATAGNALQGALSTPGAIKSCITLTGFPAFKP